MRCIFLFALWAIPAIITFPSCSKKDTGAGFTDNYPATAVLLWNGAAATAVTRSGALPPMTESRIYAAVNTAMHDALNSIIVRYERYALQTAPVAQANADAAVAQAAHDVMISLLPLQQVYADSLLAISLNSLAAGAEKDKGIEQGKAAALAMIDRRKGDGAGTAQYPYTPGSLPGQYRSTPPFDAGPNAGFVLLPGWGKLSCFGLPNGAFFRPGAPYTTSSAAYAADYNEIKTLGCAACTGRTADQTQTGLFWLENVPHSINRLAAALVTQNKLGAWQAARLLALTAMAGADANIAAFDAKYFYNFWRPVTAVRQGDADGNSSTNGDAAWNILASPTPPVPDYPSNHAADGGAALAILRHFFGKDSLSFSLTSTTLPGVTRQFTSLTQAGREISLSRIYVGYHFRMAVDSGEAMGKKIGDYIFNHSLKER